MSVAAGPRQADEVRQGKVSAGRQGTVIGELEGGELGKTKVVVKSCRQVKTK